jgi:hypothetical protein
MFIIFRLDLNYIEKNTSSRRHPIEVNKLQYSLITEDIEDKSNSYSKIFGNNNVAQSILII